MEKKSVGLLELETAVLECFLEKTPLSPLGVNVKLLNDPVFGNYSMTLKRVVKQFDHVESFHD
jgi:hypothetical protein